MYRSRYCCVGMLAGNTDKWWSGRAGENHADLHLREVAVDNIARPQSSFSLSTQQTRYRRSRWTFV